MMTLKNIAIRKATLADVDGIRELIRDQGWVMEKNVNLTMMKVDPDGFNVAFNTETGQLVGVLNAVNINDDLCFIGQNVVREEYRGCGLGYRLWKSLLPHAGDRNLSLFSVPEMEAVYRDKSDFKQYAERRMTRYYGLPSNVDSLLSNVAGVKVVSIKDVSLASLIKYDQDVTHIDRSRFLQLAIEEPETDWLAAVDVNDDIVGFGRLSVTIVDTGMIGPLYADSPDVAEVLFRDLIQREPKCTKNGIFVHSFSTCEVMPKIMDKLGVPYVAFEPSMFTKRVVTCDVNKICAVTCAAFFPF